MRFRTTRFGEITVDDAKLILLEEGILGFPDEERYVLLDHDAEGTPFKWLQSADNPDLAFVVMDPGEIVLNYTFQIEQDVVDQLDCQSGEDLIPMVVCNIPHDNPSAMTANLRGPIVVNAANRRGRQIILKDEAYAFDHRVFQEPATEDAARAAADGEAG